MQRRTVLTILGGGASASLAGCTAQSQENDRENEIDVTVRNDSRERIAVDVFFTTSDSETAFSAHYTLSPEKADESQSFRGNASRVYVVVNQAEVEVSNFVPQPCSGTNTIPVGISYNEEGAIHIGIPCSGVA